MIPEFIDKGLWLEKAEIILPWNCNRDELLNISSPKVWDKGNGCIRHTYENETIFNGLDVELFIELYPKQSFRDVNIDTYIQGENPKDQFTRVQKHLTNSFPERSTDYEENDMLPFAAWDNKYYSLSHRVFDRFGEYCILTLTRKGKIS